MTTERDGMIAACIGYGIGRTTAPRLTDALIAKDFGDLAALRAELATHESPEMVQAWRDDLHALHRKHLNLTSERDALAAQVARVKALLDKADQLDGPYGVLIVHTSSVRAALVSTPAAEGGA